jgi:hypothetical protein
MLPSNDAITNSQTTINQLFLPETLGKIGTGKGESLGAGISFLQIAFWVLSIEL